MIDIDNAGQVFGPAHAGGVRALDGINLAIRDREIVTLVGPSGCGKSTLLRLVSGLIAPTEGSISIDGEKVTAPRQDTGIVFQAPTLLPWATILENVMFPSTIMGRADDAARRRAQDLLKVAGIADFANHRPRQLSGGMQQRAAICRALVHNPSILLMDEPFGALDALTREVMTIELMRIWTATPKTILFVTHSIPEAVILADRVVVMSPRPGRIAEIIDVNLPRPRTFALAGDPEFQRCAERIRALIFGEQGVRFDVQH
ncbi:MAG TPA: ABC transporter ATP-binding protein [Vineibacter sp.]|nr:ABC transporter ATP-binding protein [Vineibacter sp.]